MSLQVATIVNQGNLLPDQYVMQVRVSATCKTCWYTDCYDNGGLPVALSLWELS